MAKAHTERISCFATPPSPMKGRIRNKGVHVNDQQFIDTLGSIGMEVFETFYDQLADESLTNQQVAALLI